jgi:hypothetical protein
MSDAPASNLLFNPVKAGLNPLHQNEIANRIAALSKDTKYFAFQQRRSKNIDAQIESLKQRLNNTTEHEIQSARLAADEHFSILESRVRLTT